MNPAPRVSARRRSPSAIAPRFLAAALLCSALTSQAKDPTGEEQGRVVPADCPNKGIMNWKDSSVSNLHQHFWHYLAGKLEFGSGYRKWTKLSPAERCKIIKDNREPANDAYREYAYELKTTDPKWYALEKLEPEEQIKIIDRLLPRLKKKKVEITKVLLDFDEGLYEKTFANREKELDNLKRAAQQKIQGKKVTEAGRKITEEQKGSLEQVKELIKKTDRSKGAGGEQDLKRIYTGGKDRDELNNASDSSPGKQTRGMPVVGGDLPAGKIGEAKSKYDDGPKEKDVPPVKKKDKPGFFSKAGDFLSDNQVPLSMSVVGMAVGYATGGGGTGMVTGAAVGMGAGILLKGLTSDKGKPAAEEKKKKAKEEEAKSKKQKDTKTDKEEGKPSEAEEE